MADNNVVNFYRGNEENLPTKAERDSNGLYVTDDSGKLFVGGKQITDIDASVVTADTVVRYDATKGKLVESALKLTANKSLIIDKGVTNSSNSIVGGTNDKSVISNILGDLISVAVNVEAPKSSANATISIGSGTNTISTGSNAIGVMNTTGVKGYYYTNINFSTNEITLSTSRSSNSGSDLATKFKDGDAISFVNDSKFPFCCKVVGSKTSGNVITVDSLPFSSADKIVTYDIVSDLAQKYLPDDFTIFACYEDTIVGDRKRWRPREGVIELGWAGTALGVMNLTTGSGAFVTGYNNWAAGDFGVVFGRDSIAGYAGIAAGYENKALATATAAFGRNNTINASYALAAGRSNTINNGNSAVFGYNNEANAASTFIAGDGNIANNWTQAVVGRYCDNEKTGDALFVVGNGSKDGSEITRSNALVVNSSGLMTVESGISVGSNTVTREENIVVGSNNTVEGPKNLVCGGDNKIASGKARVLIVGSNNETSVSRCAILGQYNKIQTAGTFAIGLYNITKNKTGQVVVGRGNAVVDDAMFIVGNSKKVTSANNTFTLTDEDRSNALVVHDDGRITAGADPKNAMDLVTLQYLQGNGGGGSGLPAITDDMQVGAILTIALDDNGNKIWKVQNPPTTVYTGEVI